MPNPENIVKHKFKKGQTGNPYGRPKKLVSLINQQLKNEGYSIVTKENILEACQILINLPYEKILDISKQKGTEYPILYTLVAKELLGKRGGEYLEKLLDRIIGKPKQSTELSGTVNISPITGINIINDGAES